jgi:hypothetical protein
MHGPLNVIISWSEFYHKLRYFVRFSKRHFRTVGLQRMVSVISHFHLKSAARTIICNLASGVRPPNCQLLISPPSVRIGLVFILPSWDLYVLILHEIWKRKSKWIGHFLRRNCLLKQVIEGKIKGELEVTRRRGRRRKKLFDDLKDGRGRRKL